MYIIILISKQYNMSRVYHVQKFIVLKEMIPYSKSTTDWMKIAVLHLCVHIYNDRSYLDLLSYLKRQEIIHLFKISEHTEST